MLPQSQRELDEIMGETVVQAALDLKEVLSVLKEGNVSLCERFGVG